MTGTVQIQPTRSPWPALNKFPWTFLLIGYMLAVHLLGLSMTDVWGFVFLGLGVLVLFAEFFKSSDISTSVFFMDQFTAVIGVIATTVLLSYMVFKLEQWPTFYHWFGAAIIVGDALLSPFNSFRTALRNFGVAG